MNAVAAGARLWRRRRAIHPLAILFLALAFLALTACGDDPTGSTPGCDQTLRIAPGTAVAGELSGQDANRAGVPIDYYSVLAPDSVRITVHLTSGAFDPFLYLLLESGEPIAQAFDSTGVAGVETVTLATAIGAGCYLIGASGWSRESRGSYTLSLERPEAD